MAASAKFSKQLMKILLRILDKETSNERDIEIDKETFCIRKEDMVNSYRTSTKYKTIN